LQLEDARRRPFVLGRNYEAHTKFKVGQPIRSRIVTFLLLIPYVTLWPWPLTLWPWIFVVYRLWLYQTLPNCIDTEQFVTDLERFRDWKYGWE